MTPSDEIDALIARTPDWRGEVLAELRRVVLAAEPGIVEEWKWMGAPVWELDGILCVGNVFKAKVKLGFLYGASLPDPHGIFNGELGGNQRRSVEFGEGDPVDAEALAELVREAVALNRRKVAEREAAKVAKREAAKAARAAAKG
ncbi:DUF1801 domain-containing protein [Rathayibacter sp. Leaf296]|uniref:DUF1801 domain-containing protein n=1 Tax=Rathayibacter sp. Leaf296 TaxID=1736327 RepID=UPI0007028873|nr:DUF1801 domain-containing protein [Rathayibacter sp. Leaf296]KQQ10990.1 hypothetical protein ASF46_08465 [Rathayibacter sp. Leaf296]